MRYAVEWDVDPEDIFWQLDAIGDAAAAEFFGFQKGVFEEMAEDEKTAFLTRALGRHPERICRFMDLPETVSVSGAEDTGELADRLSDRYGFCIRSLRPLAARQADL